MKMSDETLNSYRAALESMAHQNNHTLLCEDRMDDNQRAGTAVLLATISVSFAAGLLAEADPEMANAPMEKQISACLDLLRDVLCEQQRPKLTVV